MITRTFIYDENMPKEFHDLLTEVRRQIQEYNRTRVTIYYGGKDCKFDRDKLTVAYHVWRYVKQQSYKSFTRDQAFRNALRVFSTFDVNEVDQYSMIIIQELWKPEGK